MARCGGKALLPGTVILLKQLDTDITGVRTERAATQVPEPLPAKVQHNCVRVCEALNQRLQAGNGLSVG